MARTRFSGLESRISSRPLPLPCSARGTALDARGILVDLHQREAALGDDLLVGAKSLVGLGALGDVHALGPLVDDPQRPALEMKGVVLRGGGRRGGGLEDEGVV